MNERTTRRPWLTLLCTLALCGCPKAEAPPSPPPPTAPAAPAEQPADKLPTTAELMGLVDAATRVEAEGRENLEPTWKKTLTQAERDDLKAGIGQAEVVKALPRCLPTVQVSLYKGETSLGTLGAFCPDGNAMRFDIDGVTGSFKPQDAARINTALAPPTAR